MLRSSLACWLLVLVLVLAFGGLPPVASAADWPHWRGPDHTGISSESNWQKAWPEEPPPRVWQAELGYGLSSVSIAGGRLYTAGNEWNVDSVYCFDAATGQLIWQHEYPSPRAANEFEGGPTSTPTVDGDAVYFLGRQGDLFCFDAANGEVRWSKNVSIEADVRVPAWGFAGSPVVDGPRLLVNVGDAGLAVDKQTGELLWSSDDKDAGYASPVLYRVGDQSLAIFAAGRSYVAVDAATGEERWRQRWLTTFGCNAADPVLVGQQVFLSAAYNRGAALLDCTAQSCEVLWKNRAMENHWSTSILIDGYLYGISGDVEAGAELCCLQPTTGEARWCDDTVHYGGLTAAAGHLIALSDTGELVIGAAGPDGFELKTKQPVVDGKCWTTPVLAEGRLYCRTAEGTLVCLDLRP